VVPNHIEQRVSVIQGRGNWIDKATTATLEPLLPGKSLHQESIELSVDVVEHPNEYVLRYQIHPDRGYSESGVKALAEVPIQRRRPGG
jgi:hypothetical protein